MKLPLKILPLLAIMACDTRANEVPPEAAARDWLQRTATPYEGAPSCTGGADQHVTCVVRRPKAELASAGEFISLQCAGLGAGGCDPLNKYTTGCTLTPIFTQ